MYGPSGHTIVVRTVFVSSVLDNNSWSSIRAASDAGIAQNYWNVGDIKYITLNGKVGDSLGFNGMSIGVFILGFNHNSAIEGKGISFGTFKTSTGVNVCLVDGSYTSTPTGSKVFSVNHWDRYNYGGWKASDIRYDILGSTNVAPQNYGSAKARGVVGYDATDTCATSPVANTLMAALPSDLRAVIKPITKYTDNAGGRSNSADNVTKSIDYLPLPSEYEVQGSCSYANSSEQIYQKQYQYYINGNNRMKYSHMDTTASCYWWNRSPGYAGSDGFCAPNRNGGLDAFISTYSLGLSCVFLV